MGDVVLVVGEMSEVLVFLIGAAIGFAVGNWLIDAVSRIGK